MVLAFLPKSYADSVKSDTISESNLSPAYVLALALGVQNIAGPMTYSPADNKNNQDIISKTNDRRAPHSPQDIGYTTTISMNTRLPRPDME